MKKILFTVFLGSFIFTTTNGQSIEKLKVGGYGSVLEYVNNTPSDENNFIIGKIGRHDLRNGGGNDYKIFSEDNNIPLSKIKKNYFGIFDGTYFYINAFPFSGYYGYAKAETLGKYIYFKGIPPSKSRIQRKIGFEKTSNAFMFGVLGGAIGGAIGGTVGGAVGGGIGGAIDGRQNTTERIPILLNIETGKTIYLTKDRLYQLISIYPDLKKEYFAESEIDNEEVVLYYINKLNLKDQNISNFEYNKDNQVMIELGNSLEDIREDLYKLDTTILYQDYYDKLLQLNNHPLFENVELFHNEQANGELYSIGLKAKHHIYNSGDDIYSDGNQYYKIGTWRYYNENGQLKRLIDYNLIGKKDGRLIEYNLSGKLVKTKQYKSGKKIK